MKRKSKEELYGKPIKSFTYKVPNDCTIEAPINPYDDTINRYNIIPNTPNNIKIQNIFKRIDLKINEISYKNTNNLIKRNAKTTIVDILAPIVKLSQTDNEYKPFLHPIDMLLISFLILDKHSSAETVNNILQILQIIKQRKLKLSEYNIPNNYNSLERRMNQSIPVKLPIGKDYIFESQNTYLVLCETKFVISK